MKDLDPAMPLSEDELRDASALVRVAHALGKAAGKAEGPQAQSHHPVTLLRALNGRLRALDLVGIAAYLARLDDDPGETVLLLADALDSKVLLRPRAEFAAALSQFLVPLLNRRQAPRLWIPLCADAADVYAVAMQVADAQLALEAIPDFCVIGSHEADVRLDLDHLAATVLSGLPAHWLSRYLIAQGDAYQIAPDLRQHCRFIQPALPESPIEGGVDFIDGRYVMGILARAPQREALEYFFKVLRPGGKLWVGRIDDMTAHRDLFEPDDGAPGLYGRMRESEQQPSYGAYRDALESAPIPGVMLDIDSRIIQCNLAMQRLHGQPAEALIGQALTALLGPDDWVPVSQALRALSDSQRCNLTVQLRLADGSLLPARLILTWWETPTAPCVLAHWQLQSLAKPESSRDQQARAAALVSAGLELVKDAIVVVDTEGRITDFSLSAERLTGWPRQEAIGLPHESVLRLMGHGGVIEASPVKRCLKEPSVQFRDDERQLLSRDGRRLLVSMSYGTLRDGPRTIGVMLSIQDITEQTLLAEELAYHSEHDPITGLLNRGEFERRLSTALTDIRERGAQHLLCYVDVDQFKVINDTLGHYAGDELLRQLATLFRARIRPDDALARLGGDEFGILLRNVDRQRGEGVISSLIDGARRYRFIWESQSYAITISVGIAALDVGTESVARAFADADAACYAAKDAGRDRARWVVDGVADIRRRHGEMTMVGRIGKALDENQFLLYYEDVVSVANPSQVPYRELLVRMRGEDGRLVQPAGFIAAAERYYLMAALDRWVINAAFDGVARLPDDGVIYAVNVSGMSLSDDQFLPHVIKGLERSGVAPHRICFEITETAAITHLSEAVRFINHLAERGCCFALDDFGAGMASFSYLKNLTVQFVKIDGSFVRSMQDSSVDRGLVEAINRIGHEMGLRTIAEHVEDARVFEMLQEIGVDWVQGHAVGKGQPFEELLRRSGV